MILVTVTPAVWAALVVPLTERDPPLKVLVVVLLAVKLISSVPILISPVEGKAAELVKTTSVTAASSISVVASVVVTGPAAVPDQVPVPQP